MEEIKYQGKLLEVAEKKIERNGKSFTAEMVRRPPGARILIVKEGMILLTKEFRHELNDYDYRLPGGKVFDSIAEFNEALSAGKDPVELAKAAALKEALEEGGIKAVEAEFLHKSVCGAAVYWDLYYFLVKDFSEEGQQLEEMEDIKVEWAPVSEAKERCLSGRISEERSALVLLRYLEGGFD
jgi:ADP-ribose pyrophosphatase